jgi:hypothetical protein
MVNASPAAVMCCGLAGLVLAVPLVHALMACHAAEGDHALASQLLSVDHSVPVITVPLQHLTAVVSG